MFFFHEELQIKTSLKYRVGAYSVSRVGVGHTSSVQLQELVQSVQSVENVENSVRQETGRRDRVVFETSSSKEPNPAVDFERRRGGRLATFVESFRDGMSCRNSIWQKVYCRRLRRSFHFLK